MNGDAGWMIVQSDFDIPHSTVTVLSRNYPGGNQVGGPLDTQVIADLVGALLLAGLRPPIVAPDAPPRLLHFLAEVFWVRGESFGTGRNGWQSALRLGLRRLCGDFQLRRLHVIPLELGKTSCGRGQDKRIGERNHVTRGLLSSSVDLS